MNGLEETKEQLRFQQEENARLCRQIAKLKKQCTERYVEGIEDGSRRATTRIAELKEALREARDYIDPTLYSLDKIDKALEGK